MSLEHRVELVAMYIYWISILWLVVLAVFGAAY